MDKNKNIYLTGFMGAGKSTVGKLLAKKLSRQFVDTDGLIEKKANQTIKSIFEKFGESYFRDLEAQVIAELDRQQNLVVSLGGGAILLEENRHILNKGVWIFIELPLPILKERALRSTKRPLAKDSSSFEALYQKRISLYKLAHVTIQTNGASSEEICELILKKDKISCKPLE